MGFDIVTEQNKDEDIQNIKQQLIKGTASSAIESKHIILDDILYFISNPIDQPTPRLVVPKQLRSNVITQFHDHNGHMGVDKTFDNIKLRYYWINLYKDISEHIAKCNTCSKRGLKVQRAPLQETDFPPYAFAKVGLDLSGPYPLTLSGNKYIATFVDWYSGWPEAYPVPDKKGETIAHLLIEEIVPRYGSCLQ